MEEVMKPCKGKMEVYSRIVGYYRPVQNWNDGKREEYRQRKTFNIVENRSGFDHKSLDDMVIECGETKHLTKKQKDKLNENNNDFMNKKHPTNPKLITPNVRVNTSYIICAAIWFKNNNKYKHQPKNVDSGLVVCGRRHHNCFLTAFELNRGEKIEGLNVQGFLTSDDRFVDRKEGGQIAFDAGQTAELKNYLFSEDLY